MQHTYRIRVPSFLCRPDDRVGYDGMASLFQEAAWEHATKLGVSFTDTDSDFYWVLHRLGIRIYRQPHWGEELTITTWPSRMVRLYAMREFLVHNDAGELLVDGSTAWIVLNAETGRPERPERRLSTEWTESSWPFELPIGRLPTLDVASQRLVSATWYAVRPSDTDRNAHVNNARYLQWLIDWTPATIEGSLGVFSFTAETKADQSYTVISDESIAEVWIKDRDAPAEDAVCACRYNGIG